MRKWGWNNSKAASQRHKISKRNQKVFWISQFWIIQLNYCYHIWSLYPFVLLLLFFFCFFFFSFLLVLFYKNEWMSHQPCLIQETNRKRTYFIVWSWMGFLRYMEVKNDYGKYKWWEKRLKKSIWNDADVETESM